MNAILLLSATLAGADPVPAAAPAAAAVSGCCQSSCGNSCCDKASILDRLRAKFAKSDCGCCAPAPKCGCERAPRCKPACGTPLFQGRDRGCGCKTTSCCSKPANTCCAKPAKTCCSKPANTCCQSSSSCCNDRVSILDRLRAKLSTWRHKNDCCQQSSCCNSAPAGCAPATPAPAPAPSGDAPKTMPKKTSLVIPPTLTPVSNDGSKIIPAPVPVPVNGKSPF